MKILCLIALLLLGYTFIEARLLGISTTELRMPDLPQSFDGLTIGFMSDVHHGPFLSRARVAKAVDMVISLNADIIILGGDYVHRDAKYIKPVFKEFSRLSAPLGVYAVMGNHDHWEGYEETRNRMKSAGIIQLDNSALWIDNGQDKFRLGGVGDLWTDEQNIAPLINGVRHGDFVMLVSHNPDYAASIPTDLVDLQLSGHTHGGQVTIFGFYAPKLPSRQGQRFRSGVVDVDKMKVLISRGVGTVTPPVRFFAPPEINLIRITH